MSVLAAQQADECYLQAGHLVVEPLFPAGTHISFTQPTQQGQIQPTQ